MRHTLALLTLLLAACATPPSTSEPAAATDPATANAPVTVPSGTTDPAPEPRGPDRPRLLVASRGRIRAAKRDWVSTRYDILFEPGSPPPPGTLLYVERGGRRVGVLVAVRSRATTFASTPGEFEARLEYALSGMDDDAKAESKAAFLASIQTIDYVRPVWDGIEHFRAGDTVIVGESAVDADSDARIGIWME